MSAETLNHKNVCFPAGNQSLQGIVTIPEHVKGIVLFIHGNGNSRLCPINTRVANELNKNGFATFLVDLLTDDESLSSSTKSNIKLLTERLIIATKWIMAQKELQSLQMCYFSTARGSAAALQASSLLGFSLKAIISRGGAPDLSMAISERTNAPVLLIVGESDNHRPKSNREISPKNNHKELLFEDIGSSIEDLERLKLIADISVGWLDLYLRTSNENLAVIST